MGDKKITKNMEEQLVNGVITNGKLGYDPENGEYEVLGTVSARQIYTRKGSGTNIAPAIGYHVLEVATGRKLMVSRDEGVYIALQSGMRNSYVRSQNTVITDRETNEKVKKVITIFLHPYPHKESFTQDGRVVPVFRFDEKGRQIKPLEFLITEDQCTPKLWEEIMEYYEKSNKKHKKPSDYEQEKQLKMLNEIQKAFLSKGDQVNPFSGGGDE